MLADTVLRDEGMRVLSDKLGLVEAERFISLIIREPFDHTKWQETLYDDMSAEEMFHKVSEKWVSR